MLLLFNVDRRLTRLAADATRIEAATPAHQRPWHLALAAGSTTIETGDPAGRSAPSVNDPMLAQALEIAIVGRADQLCEALTADASGWSPTLSFSSRGEAEAALREHAASLTVANFSVMRLLKMGPSAFAEWRVEARLATPLLIGDDLLIEPSDAAVVVDGATVVDMCDGLLCVVHTYFDDAALIEQVILGT